MIDLFPLPQGYVSLMLDMPKFLEPDILLFMYDQALREYSGRHDLKSENLPPCALAHT